MVSGWSSAARCRRSAISRSFASSRPARPPPPTAGLMGGPMSMNSGQAGLFFFEPKHFDVVNQATHEHKEEIKVGYNLRRKIVLMVVWAASPLLLFVDPTLLGTVTAAVTPGDFLRNVGKLWLVIGAGGLLFRTIHLFFIKDVEAGLSCATKILTDPFHDIMLYLKSPLY